MGKSILFIDQYNKTGGGQTVLIELVNSSIELGYTCSLIIPNGDYLQNKVNTNTFIFLDDLKLNNKSKSIKDIFVLIFHYIKSIKINKYIRNNDIIYVNGSRYFFLCYFLSFLSNKKFIYHIHIDYSPLIKKTISLFLLTSSTHKFVFTSNYLLNVFISDTNIQPRYLSKLMVLEPPIARKFQNINFTDRFKRTPLIYKFISFGRIIPEKGFDTIVDIAKEYTSCKFYIVGSPEQDAIPYFNYLKKSASSNVYFFENTDDILSIINSNEIQFSIIPSRWNEPFGIVAIESMIFSCITLVNAQGGLIDISSKTGALLFNGISELRKNMNDILSYDHYNLKNISNSQYLMTRKFYNSEEFKEKLGHLLNDQVLDH